MKEFIDKLIARLEKEKIIAFKTYRAFDMNTDLGRMFGIEKSIEIINELAEEYNNDWIPCSERLPEEELEKAMRERGKNAVFPVLATINKVHPISGEKYKIVSRAFYGHYNDKNFYNSCCDRLDVIAWKHLDEPYQPKGE